MNKKPLSSAAPEITWSLMHPTPLDTDYMRRVIAAAEAYRVESFEVCGECHNPSGSLDGLVSYEGYEGQRDPRSAEEIERNRAALREMAALAHGAGKTLLYWHREVMVPRALAESIPGLLDEDGEFDLLGPAYEKLLRFKLGQALDAVPGLDGVVLTLTESDYSVIHNSRPDRYPPVRVVAHLTRIFAGELAARGKRFVLRSFGSIAQDYEDILAGAALAARDFAFEVETKITPYDFVPFLPVNPWLRVLPGATLGVECDCVGEFLGAGNLPAANVENIVNYVRAGQAAGASRYVIRLDRLGTSIFDTAYEINLRAYHRAIDEPGVEASRIVAGELADLEGPARGLMRDLLAAGIRLIGEINFIEGNVVFHTFPLDPSLKWLKAGGIFALFQPDTPLENLKGIWSILADRRTPADRERIVAAKRAAREEAQAWLDKVETLRGHLPSARFERLRLEWRHLVDLGRLMESFCAVIRAYFDGMAAADPACAALERVLENARSLFSEWLAPDELAVSHAAGKEDDHYHDIFAVLGGDRFRENYARPLWRILCALRDEYPAESAMRAQWRGRSDLSDFVLPGSVTDEIRFRRYMHAAHARYADGLLLRQVANRVFPNGFLGCDLQRPAGPAKLWITVRPDPEARLGLELDGKSVPVPPLDRPNLCIDLPPAPAGTLRVTLRKGAGPRFPEVCALAVTGKVQFA